jgi:isopentenyl-diphosphate Delta-isomerase
LDGVSDTERYESYPMSQPTQHRVVSDDAELLILVDSNDEPIGTLDKAACHDGAGVLHRAFSLFVFNAAGELLLQRRHASKRLWPGYWSNSCCSHPRAHESMTEAVARRAEEELGIRAETRYVYKFEYAASFGDAGGEHELCWVYLGFSADRPSVNATEVQDWRWIGIDALDRELHERPDGYTPWLQLEWQQLRREYRDELERWLERARRAAGGAGADGAQ